MTDQTTPPPGSDDRGSTGVHRPRRRRQSLDRERIVVAAIAYIDEHGLDQLTMRRLGGVLGVEAMALYRYVAGRDDLLDGVADSFLADLVANDAARPAGWRTYLHQLAHAVRTRAVAHPEVFTLVCNRRPAAAWIRPPLRNLGVIDAFLAALSDYGFSDTTAASTYRRLSVFLLAHLMIAERGFPVPDLTTLDQYPHLQHVVTELVVDNGLLDFDASLAVLLDHTSLADA